MNKIKYLALLRGINVGGNNIIKMNELKILFEELKFSDVRTYIQSGNVIFNDCEKDKNKLFKIIEKALFKKLSNKINIVLLTFLEIEEIINKKPKGFGEDSENKYDVIYLIEPLNAKDAVKEIKMREGVDKMYEGKKVVYISRSIKNLTKSYFSKILETPIYKSITIRNWNTTKKLHGLMAVS
ncbi:MAG: DUF1697 domain-containing protein [Fibromonadaceae bacterium]|nr:DUF1697 domain-containing protein [Fibromonadaceae bacterium]